MKTIEFLGIIRLEKDDWDKIKLVQADGYKIDLVNRFKEIKESFPYSKVQVNYWLSNKPCSKKDMVEGWLRKLYGDISADYEKNDYCYSSWTSGTDYDTILQIGGHKLAFELLGQDGRFLIIQINIEDVLERV